MGEGALVTDHIKFNVSMAKLSLVKITVDDKFKALILLSSLLES